MNLLRVKSIIAVMVLMGIGNVFAQGGWTDGGTTVRLTTSTDIVGVGTSSPYNKLDVAGNIGLRDNDLILRGTGGFDGNHGLGYYGSAKQWNGISVNGPVLYGYSGGMLGTNQSGTRTNVLCWNTTGIGIGTSNITNTLTVRSTTWDEGIRIINPNNNHYGVIIGADDGLLFRKYNATGTQTAFSFRNASDEHLLNILANGCIGIGNPNPSGILTVSGGESQFSLSSYSDPHSGVGYDAKFGGNGNGIAVRGNSYFAGNVGIGIPTPSSCLCVNGTIRAKEVIVTTQGWPDHVFKPDYNLKPLHDVEKFIKKNNHLEGIPSEKEVLKNGVSMGEMQAKLLQKLEETTLYLIELKKENLELKSRLAVVEQKVQ